MITSCCLEYIIPIIQTLYWENAGEDITYEGSSDREIPVQVSVSYYLDGAKTAPDELAGKSGKVRIRFDYKNQETIRTEVDGQSYQMQVPFAVISMMILPKDHFSDVSVENG